MDSIAISIICPVYNAERYLEKCINSILVQSFSNWELLLIDDGSQDGSGALCDKFAKSDSRLRVIHKDNQGVSAARQTGYENANGEYLIHVDPDDWIEPNMLYELYIKAQKESADMVICDFYRDFPNSSDYVKQQPYSLEPKAILKELFTHLHGSCCNKLVKRDTCVRYGVHFPHGVNFSEDVCFNIQMLLHNIKVAYLPQAYYHYVQLDSSITNNFGLTTLDNCKKYISFLIEVFSENSSEVLSAKELVKKNVVNAGILSNEEMKRLYPEVKNVSSTKLYEKISYGLAFMGYQKLGRTVFGIVKVLVKIKNNRI